MAHTETQFDEGNLGQDRTAAQEAMTGFGKNVRLYSVEKNNRDTSIGFIAGLDRASAHEERMMLLQKELDEGITRANASAQGDIQGRNTAFIVPHVFNRSFLKDTCRYNAHHNTCIQVTINAAVGLGFAGGEKDPGSEGIKKAAPPMPTTPNGSRTIVNPPNILSKEEKILGPLCHIDGSFQQLLTRVVDDLIKTGEAYIEAVIDTPSRELLGLYHMPSEKLWVLVEDRLRNFHFTTTSAYTTQQKMHFSRFGDFDRFLKSGKKYNNKVGLGWGTDPADRKRLRSSHSEIIRFQLPTSSHEWYGIPAWLPAIYLLEIMKSLSEYRYSFFRNNGVPSLLLTLLGFQDTGLVSKLKRELEENVGSDKAFRSFILRSTNVESKIQVDKLIGANEGKDGLEEEKTGFTSDIVTAHRVPPLLAGILIPGKLGANNEFPNALQSFQTLVIDQLQVNISTVLRNTLGNPDRISGINLTQEDFVFNKITDAIDLQKADTMSRMRQTVPEANAEGRDLKDGVKQ